MKTVMCFGTFDILHLGHLYYFEQAKKHGDYLIVVIARDETKKKQKKKVIFTERERLKVVQSLKVVDEAVLGKVGDHLQIVLEKKPDILCLGYDQKINEKELQRRLAEKDFHPKIIRINPYQAKYQKSKKIKKLLFNEI